MLQQRKHAWTERKKKPKNETPAGKCVGNLGKVFSHPSARFHKTSSHRQHEGGRMSCSDGNAAGLVLKGSPGGGRTFRKCSLAMSQFLPPIKALTAEGRLSLRSKQSGALLGEVKGPAAGEAWSTEGSPKTSEKENYDSPGGKGTLGLGSSPGCALSKSVHLPPNYWEEETFVIKESVDFPKPSLRKAPTPDLHKSCLLVLSTRREGGKEPKAQQVPETFRGPAGRPQTRSKTARKETWRSTEDLLKGGEKQSSGDSAFGTDTWSENVEVDLEPGLEGGGSETDYYTHRRISNWILQVNAALFSPSSDSLRCSLTEQDTSIKIVYEGD